MDEPKTRGIMPWSLILILFGIGMGLLFLGNIDRLIWSLTRDGEQVSGRVVDMHSRRTQPTDTYLTFLPRVAFTDPGGVPREMSVKRGSTHYNFRRGDKVTVLWRAESQSIAIDLPFKRHFGTWLVLGLTTLVGVAMVVASLWFAFGRWRAHRASRIRT
ncbi:uncharacterized protein DUF3592 [Litoreibacter meonggei]|uniref:Uncharacterized protein DUF3592 n=1 Tax=Litoreibacter meonggei TaxID=1049199 RepID=A0A497X2M5_9RHOB|nr:DUF3592 domain-containing protein [Litoreibacter meonggei]RLJ59983.1 uncharacterized protein DUF3592 [Litoreibacter meonggei]